MSLNPLLKQVNSERLAWFGAGLSAAALGVVAYQFLLASVVSGALPGPQPTLTATPSVTPRASATPFPTSTPRPTVTPFPTSTSRPTPTPRPTSTPTQAAINPLTGDPSVLVAAVATFAARTRSALEALQTPPPK